MYGYEALAVNTYHPDKLPPQHDGQAHTMTVNSNDDELAMGTWYSPEALRAYAAAAVAAERERCAKLCEAMDPGGQAQGSFELLADKIRAGDKAD